MKHRVKHTLDDTLNDPKLLAELRESYVPRGSGPLGTMKVITELIEVYAELKGWDLDQYIPEDKRVYASKWYRP